MDSLPIPKTNFPLSGTVKQGYGPILKAFINNFESYGELGAAFTLYHRGEKVVDLWGGYSNKVNKTPWEEDTLSVVFSATKGIASFCLLMLADRGQLDYEKTVAHYWPEFAQNGKADITVHQLLNHTSGLSGLDKTISLKSLKTDSGKARLKKTLEEQTPLFTPGSDQGYNAITFGMYAAELFKQACGEDMLSFFEREIKAPLNADVWIGNADTQAQRIAKLYQMPLGKRALTTIIQLLKGGTAESKVIHTLMKPNSLPKKVFTNPPPSINGALDYAGNLMQSNAFWWASCFASARGLAKLYVPLSMNGSHGETTFVKPSAIDPLKAISSWSEQDRVLCRPMGWNRGFVKEAPHVFSANPESFGHPGLGGALGFADPIEQLAYAYIPNYLDHHIRSPRCIKLCKSIYESEALFTAR